VGAFRPQLFLARQVMEHCSSEEVAAIAAHEAAHVRSRDNLTRLLFALTPGARLFSRSAAALEDAWVRATEEAADVLATQRAGPLALASALTRVARLAPADSSRAVVASTLISVSDLEIRVRRLLQPPASARQQRARWLPATLLVLAALSAQSPRVARTLHELFELLVRPY
jgi:Zn-dependent protease with chaperone function